MFVDEGVCVSVLIYSIKSHVFADFFFSILVTTGYWVARILEMDPTGFKTLFFLFQDKPNVLFFL